MEMALPASATTRWFSSSPAGYQALDAARIVTKNDSHVCLRAGSATVEVTALAPDLFRVGIFPDGRAVSYYSEAVVPQEWDHGSVMIFEEGEEWNMTTYFSSAHLSFINFYIGLPDH